MRRCVLLALAISLLMAAPSRGLDPNTSDPRIILASTLERARGDRSVGRIKMRIQDGSGARERVLLMRKGNFDQASRILIRIESPADLKDTAFLSIDYTDRAKADEQWLYLPHMRRVTRLPTGGRAGAFMGSDFTFADLSGYDYVDFELTLLEDSTKVDEENCWLVEAVPKTPAVREQTGYAKTQLWISKTKLLPLQFKSWDLDGRKIKYVKSSDLRKVGGFWAPHRIVARTVWGSHVHSETILELLSIDYDSGELTKDDFTVKRLEPGH